ncbi:MAG: RibD family protein [Pseudoclavibacter sp.]
MRQPSPRELRVLWRDDRGLDRHAASDAVADLETDAHHVDAQSSVPAPGSTIDLASDHAADAIERLYAPPPGPWVRMNMLGTLNAKTAGPDGTSDSISNRADRAILKRIRATSDAIIVGANTARQERMATGGMRVVIVSNSGDLSGHRLSPETVEQRVTVVCPPNAAAAVARTLPGASVHHPEGGRVTARGITAWCRSTGIERPVVEGGASLIGQFLDAGAIDEVCLTQAPVFGPDDAPSLPGSTGGGRFRRALIAADDLGFVYFRLVAIAGAAGSADEAGESAPASVSSGRPS